MTEQQIKQAVELTFWISRENIQRDDMPDVRLHRFGIFKPKSKQLKKMIKTKEEKLNHGIGNVEKLQEELDRLNSILLRVIKKGKHKL